MARDYAKHCPLSPMKNCLLVTAIILIITQAVGCQRVKVLKEVEAYPTESVILRCQFVEGAGGETKLTQVSWIWEPVEGQRDNIAVYHPTYGESFPTSVFSGRVSFLQQTLYNPSINITNLRMADAGRFTCEYATYPSGNAQGTTNLVMLARPKNSAFAMTVQANNSGSLVVVAQCVSANGKPGANIKWMGFDDGHENVTFTQAPNGTVTVISQYMIVPKSENHNKDVTCIVNQRTQDKPQTFPVKLSVEYPPSVTIEGYDNNWYMGRSDAFLTCQADGNPAPSVTWNVLSGSMPVTVQINANRLTVRKVDEAVNTTFVCEGKNRLGASKGQVTTTIIAQRKVPAYVPSTLSILGSIVAVITVLALVSGAIIFVRKRKQRAEDADGPPKHKPPPPMKTSSSTEMLNKPLPPPVKTELTQPLSDKSYYETSGEPVTDLDVCDDDDNIGGRAANGGTATNLEDSIEYANNGESFNTEALPPYSNADSHRNEQEPPPPSSSVARGESFVSAAMYV
ncbi:hypothetical protein UPYG_G00339250 [Umbra pygmaea]|uniref:Ig-like domain-containing protein n=1 Tax=Umbra pygmaea TaxID=75934 RepID=A0ABD0VWR6_UMBPY